MPFTDLPATWYQLDDFISRVDDEIYRALRYGVPFTVLTCSLATAEPASCRDVQTFVEDRLRQVDFAAKLREGRYVFGLPFTTHESAEAIVERLYGQIFDYKPRIGSASAPAGPIGATALLSAAERNGRERAAAMQREAQHAA